jgi:hypothetical protein
LRELQAKQSYRSKQLATSHQQVATRLTAVLLLQLTKTSVQAAGQHLLLLLLLLLLREMVLLLLLLLLSLLEVRPPTLVVLLLHPGLSPWLTQSAED